MIRRNRPKKNVILGSPLTLAIALVLLFFLVRAAVGLHGKATLSEEKLAEAQTTLDKAEQNRDRIATQLANISTDDGIRAEIREKYHAVEPGESVAVIVDGEAGVADARPLGAATTTPKVGFWTRFLHMIGL